MLHAQFPGSHLTLKDVKNERLAIRKSELGGYSATQALVRLLEQEGITHFVKYRDDRVTGLLIIFPWCLTMWKLFPDALMIDDTYKTNRFKMPLFNVTGISNIGSIFNAAFGLLDGEDEDEFTWAVEKLEEIRQSYNIQQPFVVLTDMERALKNALGRIWPDAQQQLCLWHICQHVALEAKKRWKGPRGAPSANAPSANAPSASARSANAPSASARSASARSANAPSASAPLANAPLANAPSASAPSASAPSASINEALLATTSRDQQPLEAVPTPPDIPHTPQGLTMLWKCAVQAPREEEFEEAWARILQEFPEQEAIIEYIVNTWFPWRRQFLNCYTSQYRNHGIRVTSRVESSHAEIKSYLYNGQADLLFLIQSIQQMLTNKQREYDAQIELERARIRCGFEKLAWLGELRHKVSKKGLDLIYKQWLITKPFIRQNRPQPPYTGRFEAPYSLPCRHKVEEAIMTQPL